MSLALWDWVIGVGECRGLRPEDVPEPPLLLDERKLLEPVDELVGMNSPLLTVNLFRPPLFTFKPLMMLLEEVEVEVKPKFEEVEVKPKLDELGGGMFM